MEPIAKILSSSQSRWNPASMKLWAKYEEPNHPLEVFEAGLLGPILNSLGDAIIIFDLSGKAKVFNRMAVNLLGGDILEIDSPEWLDKFSLRGTDKLRPMPFEGKSGLKALHSEETNRCQGFLISPSHPTGIFIEMSTQSIQDDAGAVYGSISTFRDISNSKCSEERLRHSKTKFETMAHLINDVIWEWDVERDISFRHGASHALGYSEDIVHNGKKWWMEKIHPDDFPKMEKLFFRVMNGEVSTWFEEYRFRRADGSYAFVVDRGSVIAKNAEGKPTHMMAAIFDITQRKLLEPKLAQFAAIVESTSDAVVTIGFDGTIASWNPSAERLWGYSEKEMLGKHSRILIDDFDRRHEEARTLIERGESILRGEVWGVRKNGDRVLVSSTLSPIRDDKGNITGISAISRDITDIREQEEKIRKLSDNLKRSNQDLKQFASVASHDLREPLRMISSFASLLARDYDQHFDNRGREFIQRVLEGSKQMRVLIDDLLLYSQVEQVPIRRQTVNCESVVQKVKVNLSVAVAESSAEIRWGRLPTIQADEVQLGQLFQNLIANAIKFRKGRLPKIEISAEAAGKEWIFSVRDNGIGIDSRFNDQIFQVFRRLHSRNDYPGTGLGLAIAQRIIDRHGGRIWFESKLDEGTTFFFSLPD